MITYFTDTKAKMYKPDGLKWLNLYVNASGPNLYELMRWLSVIVIYKQSYEVSATLHFGKLGNLMHVQMFV